MKFLFFINPTGFTKIRLSRKSIYLFLSFCLLLFSCENYSKYPDYSNTSSGIFYKLHYIGDENRKPKPGEYITADLVYQTISDSVFFEGRRIVQVTEPEFAGSVDECFVMLSMGDSASFIINADKFFEKTLKTELPPFLKKKSEIKISIHIEDINSPEEYLKEKEEFLSWINDFGKYEKTLLRHYIEGNELGVVPNKTGLYCIRLNEGTGKKVEKGDTVTVNWEGRFLNGEYFDSTIKRNQPFEFVYGEEWQVVKGMEEAIGMMREGEKAIFIMPSKLAFGVQGSSTGIVPPFTSVIYEVELLKVK